LNAPSVFELHPWIIIPFQLLGALAFCGLSPRDGRYPNLSNPVAILPAILCGSIIATIMMTIRGEPFPKAAIGLAWIAAPCELALSFTLGRAIRWIRSLLARPNNARKRL
jgi:hypothetical protein